MNISLNTTMIPIVLSYGGNTRYIHETPRMISTLIIVICFAGMLSNVTSIVVFVNCRRLLRNLHIGLLTGQSAADLLYLIVIFAYGATMKLSSNKPHTFGGGLGDWLYCNLWRNGLFVSVSQSFVLYSLGVLTIASSYSISKSNRNYVPQKSRFYTCILVTCSMFSLVFVDIVCFLVPITELKYGRCLVGRSLFSDRSALRAYAAAYFAVNYCLPFLVISSNLAYILSRVERRSFCRSFFRVDSSKFANDQFTVVELLIRMTTFAALLTSLRASYAFLALYRARDPRGLLFDWSLVLSVTFSASNPALYYGYPVYRAKLRDLLTRCSRRRSNVVNVNHQESRVG